MIRRSFVSIPFAVLLAIACPYPISPQEPREPEALYQRALSQLTLADTTAALETLRRLTELARDYAPGWGLLGIVLTERASGVATDFADRREAEDALFRALRLEPDNAEYLIALASLRRKQQMYLDAGRVLSRATDKAREHPGKVSGESAAEMWFEQGLRYEDGYLDTRHLVFAPNVPVGGVCDIDAPTFCMNFDRPDEFNEYFRHASDLSEFGEDDFEKMADAFRRALAADPAHAGAFRRLAVHLVDRRQYRDALSLAYRYTKDAPRSPWGHITLGLIYQRQGNDSLAEAHFDHGLELADPEIAEHYRNVAPILRSRQAEEYSGANEAARRRLEEVLWKKSDPLYLTEENEVRVAHLARVAFADLMFEDPSTGTWGSETERGEIYVRYGPPLRIWQLHRDKRKELTPDELAELQARVVTVPRQTDVYGGGRWIFWNYGWDLPNFIFEKELRYRRTKHQFSSYSKAWEEDLREAQPAEYRMSLLPIPIQVARFRGGSPDEVAVEVHAALPLDRLAQNVDLEEAQLETGLFLVDAQGEKTLRDVKTEQVSYGDAAVARDLRSWRLMLRPGDALTAAVETRDVNTDRAAAGRAGFQPEAFPADSLSVSDILLADAIRPLAADPADRGDLDIAANPAREYVPLQPVHIYYEIYGLQPDDENFASFEVALAVRVERLERGEGLLALLGLLADTWGFSVVGDDRVELRFTREVDLKERDRVMEYLSLDLQKAPAGEYEIDLRIYDRLSDQLARRQRTFTVVEPE